jgi:hypothetical protein
MPQRPRPGQKVRWRNPQEARAWGWGDLFGPGPFEVVGIVDNSECGLAAGLILRTRIGEREIPEVWLALADEPVGGGRGPRRHQSRPSAREGARRACSFSVEQGGAMPGRNPARADPATPARTPQPGLKESAEGCLRRHPYLDLKQVSCDSQGGVLVLRGRLPTYYLKQVAQEVVAHQVQGVERIDNQIRVVTPASR